MKTLALPLLGLAMVGEAAAALTPSERQAPVDSIDGAAREGAARLADLRRIAEADPGSSGERHMDRARALAILGRGVEALAAANAAVAAEPHNFGLPVGRGEVLDQLGRRAEAADSYRAGLRLLESWLATSMPEEAAHYLRMRVLLLARLGRAADAITLVDSQRRRFAGNARLLVFRCQARAEANVELERALADCNEALETEPGHEEASFARGLAFLRMERWAEAERDFTSLLEIQPGNPDALYGRGLARQRMREVNGAAGDFAAARRHLFYIDSEFDRRGLRQAPPVEAAASPQ